MIKRATRDNLQETLFLAGKLENPTPEKRKKISQAVLKGFLYLTMVNTELVDLIKFALSQEYPPEYKYFSATHSPKQPWLTKYYSNFGFKVIGKTEVGNIKLTRRISLALKYQDEECR